MENYIVRIYRRDESDPDKLTGVFESVENETRNSFTSLNSLIDLLTPARGITVPSVDADDENTGSRHTPG